MAHDDFNILIVDDEEDLAKTIASSLQALTDYKIEAFSDPYKALQRFIKAPFHLVITDITMPNIDGFELIKRMKSHRPNTDFIIITAHKKIEIVTRARRLGAAYIFYKPVDIEALLKAVDTMYGRLMYWINKLNEVS